MNILARLRAMLTLGDALIHRATTTRQEVILEDDAARVERVGDIDGQTARAQAFADELAASTVVR